MSKFPAIPRVLELSEKLSRALSKITFATYMDLSPLPDWTFPGLVFSTVSKFAFKPHKWLLPLLSFCVFYKHKERQTSFTGYSKRVLQAAAARQKEITLHHIVCKMNTLRFKDQQEWKEFIARVQRDFFSLADSMSEIIDKETLEEFLKLLAF